MRHLHFIIIGIATLLFASCGQQHQAEEVIQAFVETNAADPSTLSQLEIVRFDSTKVIADSILLTMRTKADTIQRYRKQIKYADGPIGRKLFVARVNYTLNNTPYSDTYYLDDQLLRVIAFKSN